MSTVSQAGTATATSSTSGLTPSVTGTWGTGQNRTAPNLLIAVVTTYGNSTAFLGDPPSGWSMADMSHTALTSGSNATAVYFKTAAGSDSAPAFTAVMTGTAADCRLDVTLYEYSDSGGGTPVLATTGTAQGTSGATLTTTTRLNVLAGSAALAAITVSQGTTAATASWTPPAGWTAGPNITASIQAQFAIWTLASPSAGTTLAAALPKGRTTTTLQSGIIAVISPAGSARPMYHDALSSASANGVTSGAPLSFTLTSNTAGCAVVVGVSAGDRSATGTGSVTVTCGGTSMTAITASEQPGTGGDSAGFARMFGLANVGSGSHTIVVTPNQTLDLECSARAIAGADTSSPFGADTVAQGTSTTISATKTGTSGNIILYASCSGINIGAGPQGPAYRTYAKSLNGGSGGGNADHGGIVATGSSQTISSLANSDDWAIIATEILAPSGGGSTSATAGLASGTGTAPGPGVTLAANAAPGPANATGSAPGVTAAFTVQALAGAATATGTAPAPSLTLTANAAAGGAAGTGTAPQPAAQLASLATAGPAISTGTAPAPGLTLISRALPAAAAATGTAPAPGLTLASNAAAGAAQATGTAPGVTASTSAATSAAAGLASGTGTAPGVTAVFAVQALAGLASGTGTAPAPAAQPAAAPAAGLAAATGTAPAPSLTLASSAAPGNAAGTGTAPGVTASTVPSASAIAGLAAGTGTAPQPSLTLTATAAPGPATATGTAPGVTASTATSTSAIAGLAAGTGLALAPALTLAALARAQAATALGTAPGVTGQGVTPAVFGTATPGGAALTAATAGGAALATADPGGLP